MGRAGLAPVSAIVASPAGIAAQGLSITRYGVIKTLFGHLKSATEGRANTRRSCARSLLTQVDL
jgi:hypothetical protein